MDINCISEPIHPPSICISRPLQLRMRTLERKKSSASRLNSAQRLNSQQSGVNGGAEKNEFDDLISALRTGDVFGENMDKFRRNRFVFTH